MNEAARARPGESRVWVIDGGPTPLRFPSHLAEPTTVICADSGLTHALDAGIAVDVLVGDLDSVAPQTVERWRRANPAGAVEHHDADKDNSDLDLALRTAIALGPHELVVVSGGSGRLDHLLVGMLALAAPAVCAHSPTAYLRDAVALPITAGQTRTLPLLATKSAVTLVAIGGAARAKTTGLRWNLEPTDPLEVASTRGLSNEPTGYQAPQVTVTQGTLLALVVPLDDPTDEP